MTTQTVTTNESDTTCVSELIQPLVEALQTYAANPRDEIETVLFSAFEGQQSRWHETHIALDIHAETPDELLRALWTILEETGSSNRWLNFFGPDEHNRYDGPLMFALVQQRYGSGGLELHSYLWAYSRDEDFDVTAAKRQVANLVELIRDPQNLIELTPELQIRL